MDGRFALPPMTPAQRRATLVMRPWSHDERRIVQRGTLGRFLIAIEPALIAVVFGWFGYWLGTHGRSDATHDDWIFSIIFVPGALVFAIYAVMLLIRPFHALRQTYEPIFVVDGFIRTRGRDDFSASDSNGYVAVLTDERRVACEWPAHGKLELPFDERPAMLEFSEFGGVHTVDGRRTGVLPEDFPVLGIGPFKKQ
jgi:hypothetical protein